MSSTLASLSARGSGGGGAHAGDVGSHETNARGAMVLMNSPLHAMYICTRRLKLLCWVLAELSSASTLLEDYTRGMLNLARLLVLAWQAVLLAATTQSRLDRRLAALAQEDESATRPITEHSPSPSTSPHNAQPHRSRHWGYHRTGMASDADNDEEDQTRRTRLPRHVYRAVRALWAEYMDDENEVARLVERIRRVVVAALYQQYLHITVETSEDLLLREGLEPPSRSLRRAELMAAYTRAQHEVSAARVRRARRKRGRGRQPMRAPNAACDERPTPTPTLRAGQKSEDSTAEPHAADDVDAEEDDDDTLLPVPLSLFMHVATAASPTVRAFHCMSRCVLYARGVHSLDDEDPLAQEQTQYRRLRERQREDEDEEEDEATVMGAQATTTPPHATIRNDTPEAAPVTEEEEHEGYYYVVIAARAVGACAHVQPCFGNCKFMFVKIAYEPNFTPSRLARQLNAFVNTFAPNDTTHEPHTTADATTPQPLSSSTGPLALRDVTTPYIPSESEESNSAMSEFYDSFTSSAHGSPLGFILHSARHRPRRGHASRDEADVVPNVALPPYLPSSPTASSSRRQTREEARPSFAGRAVANAETPSEEDGDGPAFIVMHAVCCSLLTSANATNAPASPAMRHNATSTSDASAVVRSPTISAAAQPVDFSTVHDRGSPATNPPPQPPSTTITTTTSTAMTTTGGEVMQGGLQAQLHRLPGTMTGFEQTILMPPNAGQVAFTGPTLSQSTPSHPPLRSETTCNAAEVRSPTTITTTTTVDDTTAVHEAKAEPRSPRAVAVPSSGDLAFADELYARLHYWCVRGQTREAFRAAGTLGMSAVKDDSEGSQVDERTTTAATTTTTIDGEHGLNQRRPASSSVPPRHATMQQQTVTSDEDDGVTTAGLHMPLKLLIGDVGWITFTATPPSESVGGAEADDGATAARGVTNLKGQELLYHALTASSEAVVCAVRECRAHHRFHDKLHTRAATDGAPKPMSQPATGNSPQQEDEDEGVDSVEPQCTLSEDEYDVFAFDHYTHLGVVAEVRWCQGESTDGAKSTSDGSGGGGLCSTAHEGPTRQDYLGVVPHLTAREARQLRNERLKNEFRLARSARLDVLLVNEAQGKPIASITLEAMGMSPNAGVSAGAARAAATTRAATTGVQPAPSAQEAVHSSMYAVTVYSPYVAPLWNYLRREKMLLVDLDRTLVDNAITLPAAVGGPRSGRMSLKHGHGAAGMGGRGVTNITDRPAFFSWPGTSSLPSSLTTAQMQGEDDCRAVDMISCSAAHIEAEELAVMFGPAEEDDTCCCASRVASYGDNYDDYYYRQHYGHAPCASHETTSGLQRNNTDNGGGGKRNAYALHFERYGPVRYYIGTHRATKSENGVDDAQHEKADTSDATRMEMIYVRPHLRRLLHRLAIQWAIPLVLVTKSSATRTAAILSQILDPCGLLFTQPARQVLSAAQPPRHLTGCQRGVPTSSPMSGGDDNNGSSKLPFIAEAQKSALEVIRRYDAFASEEERVGKTRSVAILDDAPHVWRETCWPYTVSIPPYTLSRVDPTAYFGPNGYLAVLILSCLYSVRSIVCPNCTACEDATLTSGATGAMRWPHCFCSCPVTHRSALERATRRGWRSSVFVDEAVRTRGREAAQGDMFVSPRRKATHVPRLLLLQTDAESSQAESTSTTTTTTTTVSSSSDSVDDDDSNVGRTSDEMRIDAQPDTTAAVVAAKDTDNPLMSARMQDATTASYGMKPPYLPHKRHSRHDRPKMGRTHGHHASLSLPPTPSVFHTAASMSLSQTSALPPLASLPSTTAMSAARPTSQVSTAYAERATLPGLLHVSHASHRHAIPPEPDTIAASEAIVEEEDDDDSVDMGVEEQGGARPRVADSEEAVGVVRTTSEAAEVNTTRTRRHSWWATDDVEDVVPL